MLRVVVTAAATAAAAAAAPTPPPDWAPRIAGAQMLWAPTDTDVDPTRMPTIGNGFVATQLCNPTAAGSTTAVYAAGVYNGAISNRAIIPTGLTTLCVPAPAGAVPGDSALDVQRATYYRRSYLAPSGGGGGACGLDAATSCTSASGPVTVEQRFYAHRALPSVMVLEVEVTGPPAGAAGPYAMLALTNAGTPPPGKDFNFTAVPPALAPPPPFSLALGWTAVGELNDTALTRAVAVLASNLTYGGGSAHGLWPVAAPGTTLTFLTVVRTSLETQPGSLVDAVQADYAVAAGQAARGVLHATHVAEWAATLWDAAGFETDRLDVAAAVNASAYAIYTAIRTDVPYSLSPGGLASNGYEGCVLRGRVGRRGLRLRYGSGDVYSGTHAHHRLHPSTFCPRPRAQPRILGLRVVDVPAAGAAAARPGGVHAAVPRAHAAGRAPQGSVVRPAVLRRHVCVGERRHGPRAGARAVGRVRDPHLGRHWCVAGETRDSRPYGDWGWQPLTLYSISHSPHSPPLPRAAVAAWQLWRLLGDNGGGWLQGTAWPLLSGVSDFWLSKLAVDNPGEPPGSPLHLVGVMPPDEYANNVTDCIWTNAGAVLSLTYAAAVGGMIGADPVVLARYADAAGRIVIPYNATPPPGSGMGPGGWHPEYDGFPPNITIKQADVVLLGFPMQFTGSPAAQMNAATRANDLLFYGPRTDPGGPAMTWAMHAVGFLELRRWADAAGYFNRSFATVQPPFGVWWETTGGDTSNFITGAGGFLQAAYNGYTGLRVNDTALGVDPALPEGTGLVRLRGIAYRGNRLDVSYDAGSVTFQLQAPPPPVADDDAPAEHRHAYDAAALEGDRIAAGLPRGWRAALSLAPTTRLSARSQVGRVVLDAYTAAPYTVAVAPLEVVDAAGTAHPLTPGGPPVTLAPLQRAAVRAVGTTTAATK